MQKKEFIFAATVLMMALCNFSTAYAGSEVTVINIECPRVNDDGTTSGVGVLHHDGSFITGLGREIINGVEYRQPILSGVTPNGVPTRLRLGSYYRSRTAYDMQSGKMSCIYESASTYPPIIIAYHILNGQGGYIRYQTPKSISVGFMMGII